MAKTQTLTFKRTVSSPPAEVFRAFTNSSALREWFSDAASVEARDGGRLYFAWNNGHYVTGQFTKLVPGRKVAFTWQGRGEPEPSKVSVSLAARKDGTSVKVEHDDVPAGKKFAEISERIRKGWEIALENLQAVQERGEDLRITMRPMLGVSGLEILTPEIAERIRTKARYGVRIDGTVAGMGAEASGMRKDDVIVSMDGQKVASYPSIVTVLQDHRAGDKMPVEIYRGDEKLKLTLELSKRPLPPPAPSTAAELAEAVRAIFNQSDAEVAACFEGVDEAHASQAPAEGEWSAKEILAHLLHTERYNHTFIAELLAGSEASYDQYPNNVDARVKATVAAYGTAAALLEELRRSEAETVGLLENLPPDFVARTATYTRVAQNLIQNAPHTSSHMAEIRAAISAARGG